MRSLCNGYTRVSKNFLPLVALTAVAVLAWNMNSIRVFILLFPLPAAAAAAVMKIYCRHKLHFETFEVRHFLLLLFGDSFLTHRTPEFLCLNKWEKSIKYVYLSDMGSYNMFPLECDASVASCLEFSLTSATASFAFYETTLRQRDTRNKTCHEKFPERGPQRGIES